MTATFPYDRDLDHERGRLAADRARAHGKSALECIIARIEASFSVATRYNLYKRRVRAIMRGGPDHQEALRYRRLVEQLPPNITLGGAVAIMQRAYVGEVRRREGIERTWGVCHEPRMGLMLLDELRLMLRWCRRYAPQQFEVWRDQLNGG